MRLGNIVGAVGVYCVASGVMSIRSGKVGGEGGGGEDITREDGPISFWFIVLFKFCIGFAMIFAAWAS